MLLGREYCRSSNAFLAQFMCDTYSLGRIAACSVQLGIQALCARQGKNHQCVRNASIVEIEFKRLNKVMDTRLTTATAVKDPAAQIC